MGIHDEVIHPNAKKDPQIDERTIRGLEGKDLQARDILWKAGKVIEPPLAQMAGFIGLFFYEGGPNAAFYKTLTAINNVPEKVSQLGCSELTKAVMRAYGIKVPGEDA